MWRLAEDTIDSEDLAALSAWLLQEPHLTQGPLVREFESAWAEWLKSEHAVVVSSGTTANFALTAAALARTGRPVPRVGVSAVTWSTNVTPALLLGAEVVVFDVDPASLGVDPSQVVDGMDAGELDVLFVTHALGFDALTDDILAAAERNDVVLIEDCCEAHGARHGEKKVGSLGLGGTFSFYFGHHMSTIEGGVVVTDDAELADELRLMRAHGLARESSAFHSLAAEHPEIHPQFLFVSAGLNFRSSDLNAFLGLRQLRQLDDRIALRNANLERFLPGLPAAGYWTRFRTAGASSFALPLVPASPEILALLDEGLDDAGIESRPLIAGNLLRQPFIQSYGHRVTAKMAPNADHLHAVGRYVGNGHHVTPAMVDRLLEIVSTTVT